jgi:phosphoenolpyruvate-protein kinase (PTS system EI component)
VGWHVRRDGGLQKTIPVLAGLGLDKFSMTPRLIREAKWLMQQLTEKRMKEITEIAMSFHTA